MREDSDEELDPNASWIETARRRECIDIIS
jgi:hypothetical protein